MAEIKSSNREEEWGAPDYWRKICTNLSLREDPSGTAVGNDGSSSTATDWKDPDPSQHRRNLREKGYSLVDSCLPLDLIGKLRAGIELLHKRHLPATFILLFDETWELARLSRQLFAETTSNDFHFDFLAWFIDQGGFSPHRDRQPEDVAASFFDGNDEAKFVTHWIALTPATTANSCLYMIPKDCDPGYKGGDQDDKDPLRVALPDKESFQRIRAMPRNPGQSLLFTHRIIHWGSIKEPDADPRIAISFVCSDPSYEKPYIKPSYFGQDSKNPPFKIRLLLVCAQLLIYYQRFDLPKDCLRACYSYCKEMEDELEVSYRHKVYVEYVKAMKEEEKGNLNEDEEEEMMEEMLNAEQSGYGEFVDDFDEAGDAYNGDGGTNEEDDIDLEEEGELQFGNGSAQGNGDSEEEEEEEEVNLFGKRNVPPVASASNGTKRIK